MASGVEPAKTTLPRRRWLAFLDCAAADEQPTGETLPPALNEDIESEVHTLMTADSLLGRSAALLVWHLSNCCFKLLIYSVRPTCWKWLSFWRVLLVIYVGLLVSDSLVWCSFPSLSLDQ